MGWINLLWKFLRLGPLPIGAIATVIMGAGYYLQVLDNERSAKEAQALRAGIPDVVQLADAPYAEQRSIIGEVNVQAQLAWQHSYDLWYEENIGTDYIVMFPLIAANGTSLGEVLGVALFQAEDESFQTLTEDMVADWFVADGAHGPVMNLNGELDGMGKWQGLVEESFYDEGLEMPADPIVIWPYVGGRTVALAPPAAGDMTIFGVFSKVAGVLGLLALGKLVFTGKPEDEVEVAPPVAEKYAVAPVQVRGVPLWKQRSGLPDEVDAETPPLENLSFRPEPVQPIAREDSANRIDLSPKPRAFGLRKAMIGVIGSAFAVLLAATAWGMVQDGPWGQIASVSAPPETAIQVATPADDRDVFIKAADWIDATIAEAENGDVQAMIYIFLIAAAAFSVAYLFKRALGITGKNREGVDDLLDGLGSD